MKINFPNYAEDCIRTLESSGFEAYFVGGCVRDALLGRDFFDIDITTNALPEQIEAIFPKTIPTGKKHGTITVIIDEHLIEVTTFRSESGYDDLRHPLRVVFQNEIESDLMRRDFTINALAYNSKAGLIDLFGGQSDLSLGIIRCIGNPADRFSEDSLRIMRAYRFASVLGFKIDKDTEDATYSCGEGLSFISGERVLTEIKKLSLGKNPNVISKFLSSNYLKRFGIGQPKTDLSKVLTADNDIKAAVFITCTDYDSKLLKDVLKINNLLLCQISNIEKIKSFNIPNSKPNIKQQLSILGEENISLYLSFINTIYTSKKVLEITKYVNEIIEQNEPFCINHLAINGHDLLNLGVQDIKIGGILSALLSIVIENPSANEKNNLLSIAKTIINQ